MKTVFTLFAIAFLSFQGIAQDTPASNNSAGDVFDKMIKQINSCDDISCLADFYNRMAGVCTGKTFANDQEKAKNVMVFIFKAMDKHRPGVLFDVYMKADKKYQDFFLAAAKKLPVEMRTEIVRRSKAYQKNNTNNTDYVNTSNTTTTSKSDDLANMIDRKIKECSDGVCLAKIFNAIAKTTTTLKNKQQGIKIMSSVLKIIDTRKPGMLFDVYLECESQYRDHFIAAVKLLPKDVIRRLLVKMKNYQKNNN